MWRDENGFKHKGPSSYVERKLSEMGVNRTAEEKHGELYKSYVELISKNV